MSKVFLKIAVICLLSSAAFSQPVLECSHENFDFGFTVHNAIIVHKIWLKSSGTDTVKIKDIQTGGSGTTMPLSRNEIAPGDSLEVAIRWNTQKTHGPVKRYPSIFYEGADEPLRLGLFTDVQYVPDSNLPVTIWPFRFELGKHLSRSIDSLGFRIKNTTDKEIRIMLVSHIPEQCDIVLPQMLPPNGEGYGFIKLKPEYKEKEFEDSITVGFSHDDKYFITVPIRRKIYAVNQG